ncbi:hypothetical protein BMS3Bbin06_00885 [bacterium BMS3Bbin06]|nr:hypothetical protein BMS3Abin08_00423 [bacterium BMS3Abin08]GBE34362.1 hypothetical protein BMS3Bbin06_00885 [bacterium BMS3Bbin06]HDO35446.1 hypothetical protein [Nitrospirota bacterium]
MKLDKRNILLISIFALILLNAVLFFNLRSLDKRERRLKTKLSAMTKVYKEYKEASSQYGILKKRAFIKETPSASALEGLLEGLQLRGKLTRIKPIQKKTVDGYSMEDLEVEVSGLTLEELVRLLYRLENGREGFIVRSMRLKRAFSEEERLDSSIEVLLLRAGSGS